MELKGKTAIVTGSGRGIGQGIAVALGRAGANVVVSDLRVEACRETVEQIQAAGARAMAVAANVTNSAQLEAMVAAAAKELGTIDILVNNAGIEAPPAKLTDISEASWDRVLGVNLKGVFLCCKAVIPVMVAQGRGKIINVSSLAGLRMTFFGSAEYTASKYGVEGLTHHLAWELAEHGITVNAICPGATMTPLAEEGSTPEYRAAVTQMIPLRRWCTIDDIGAAAVFLASDHADLITGHSVPVDGGMLTGWGEALRPMINQRIAALQASRGSH